MRGDAIYVCAPEAENCCCGRTEKGNPPIDPEAWRLAWTRHPASTRFALVPTKCLGPCDRANVVVVRRGGTITWLGRITTDDVDDVLDYASALASESSTASRLDERHFIPDESTILP